METREEFSEHERPVVAWCDPEMLYVRLADERRIGVPLDWHPFLLKASQRERAVLELQDSGIWWPELDEGISVKSMLMGWKSPDTVSSKLNFSEPSTESSTGLYPLAVLRTFSTIPEGELHNYKDGACSPLDYRSKIHGVVHDSYRSDQVVGFDYDRFFAATDTLLDSDNMLCMAERMDWPKSEYVGKLLMFGVFQALAVQNEAALQLLKCFGKKSFFIMDETLKEIKELRVSVAGHPSDHKRIKLKGCTFLGHRMSGATTKFAVCTYENFTKFIQREFDMVDLINRQKIAVEANLAKVWIEIKDSGTIAADLFSER